MGVVSFESCFIWVLWDLESYFSLVGPRVIIFGQYKWVIMTGNYKKVIMTSHYKTVIIKQSLWSIKKGVIMTGNHKRVIVTGHYKTVLGLVWLEYCLTGSFGTRSLTWVLWDSESLWFVIKNSHCDRSFKISRYDQSFQKVLPESCGTRSHYDRSLITVIMTGH